MEVIFARPDRTVERHAPIAICLKLKNFVSHDRLVSESRHGAEAQKFETGVAHP
jgi:hypothetical protein